MNVIEIALSLLMIKVPLWAKTLVKNKLRRSNFVSVIYDIVNLRLYKGIVRWVASQKENIL